MAMFKEQMQRFAQDVAWRITVSSRTKERDIVLYISS